MPFTRAGQLARHTPTVLPDSPLGLIAENLRESRYGTVPVLDSLPDELDETSRLAFRPRILGLIDERDLAQVALPVLDRAEALRISGNGVPAYSNGTPLPEPSLNGHHAVAPEAIAPELDGAGVLRDVTAREIMRPEPGYVPAQFSLHNALLTLDRYEVSALPVLDENGGYRGMISRSDVVAALGGAVRPPVVGGMATPMGVWLTTGYLSAGAPPLGLVLSGAVMGGLLVLTHLVTIFVLNLLNPTWGQLAYSGRLGVTSPYGSPLNMAVTVFELFLFLLGMRLLPLSGTHAAEHQTVWAIEKGLPLRPEIVRTMPRAHPRCGTNLVALAAMIQIIFQHLPSIDAGTTLLALMFVFFAWRSFGTALQVYFTTRPASPKQLESGIRAGQELLEKYQSEPHVMMNFGQRLFNSGILLSAIGMFSALALGGAIETFLANLILGGR